MVTKPRAAVGMSGGVDSSLAAALLIEQGYDVIGITQQIWVSDEVHDEQFGGCCGLDAINSARRVAGKLGVPHYVLDYRDSFADKVVSIFCQEYSRGRTPNPCVACNQYMRFGMLLEKVLGLGMDYLATGHYARIEHSSEGYRLLKGVDPAKDQSYFLYTLGQKELPYILLPLGEYHKTEVRKMAAERGLPSASRPDSQDICFIDDDYRAFISKFVTKDSGEIVDTSGKVLGEHKGLTGYTIGQRHGLGIAAGEPRYVLKIDAEKNKIIVGGNDELLSSRLLANNLKWVSGGAPETPLTITAKIRYRAAEAEAILYLDEDTAVVQFREPQRAITPGQSVVFYLGEVVLGGGIIDEAG